MLKIFNGIIENNTVSENDLVIKKLAKTNNAESTKNDLLLGINTESIRKIIVKIDE